MQPIATAPKDGSFVILEDEATGTREIAKWLGDNWVGENGTSIPFHPTRWTIFTEKQDGVDQKRTERRRQSSRRSDGESGYLAEESAASGTRSRPSSTRSRPSAVRSKPRDRATQKGRSSNVVELSSSLPFERRTRYRSKVLLLLGICSAMMVVLLFFSHVADHQATQMANPETSSRSVESSRGSFLTNSSNESPKAGHRLETEHVIPVTADNKTIQNHSENEGARADALAKELAEARREMEARLALATARATQAWDFAQAAETTGRQHQQALDEERARADALAKELAEARREMENRLVLATATATQASDSAQAAEATQQALDEEGARADALAKELAETRREMEARLALATARATQASDSAQAAETTGRQREQALDEERSRADALAKELAETRREMEARLALATATATQAVDSARAAEASTRDRQQGLRDRLVQLQASLAEAITAVSPNAQVAVDRSSGWTQYREKDLGLAFDLPTHIFPLESAKRGSLGTSFFSAEGRAQVRVFGSVNEANETPRHYLHRTARREQINFTYVRIAQTFFVASGTRDETIFYRRCNFSRSAEKRIGCIQLDYPQREKSAWDASVTRMSRSLRMVAPD
jgi:hypothetical protein